MSRTNYIFIDYENVPGAVLDRIEGKPVEVVLVLGQRQKNLPVALVKLIQKCPQKVRLVETELNGKNALDFVLACEVGAEAERDPKGYFHIVSRDTGFDALVTHLKTKGILAGRCTALEEIPVLTDKQEERIARVVGCLKKTAAARPKKRKTLESHVQTLFAKSLTPEELEEVIGGLITRKLIAESETGAITFNL